MDRIKALIETGNTENEVLKQVINDGTLRGLSQEDFDKVYSEQKQEVYNKLENNTDFRILIKDNQNKFDEIFQKEN